MSCSRCGCNTNPCCCNRAPQQIVGPPGPMGFTGPQGATGPQGPVGPQGPGSNIESGTFTQLIILGPGNKSIGTLGTIKSLWLTASEQIPSSGAGSDGKSNLLIQNCIYTDGTVAKIDAVNCINISSGGNGWTGTTVSFGAVSGFIINFAQIGLGSDIIVQWHAIIA